MSALDRPGPITPGDTVTVFVGGGSKGGIPGIVEDCDQSRGITIRSQPHVLGEDHEIPERIHFFPWESIQRITEDIA